MSKDDMLKVLDESIIAIENNKYKAEFINGGYSYSDNLTNIIKLLEIYQKLYFNKGMDLNKTKLIKNNNQDNFNLLECIVYFSYLWHLEGSGISVGIIYNRIKTGQYLKALKRFEKLLKENND